MLKFHTAFYKIHTLKFEISFVEIDTENYSNGVSNKIALF